MKNKGRIDYDYKVGQKVLVRKEGILRKSESIWHRKPWLIMTVHTNGTITAQCGNKLEWMNIRREEQFVENSTFKSHNFHLSITTITPYLHLQYL